MAKSSTFASDWLKLVFNGTPIAGLADNAAAGALAQLYVGLHTADPGVGGAQTTNETAYTGYLRQAVARSAAGFTVAGTTVTPVGAVPWAVCTGVPGQPITHFSIGTSANGAGKVLYSGALDAPIPMAIGVVPQLLNATSVTEA